MPESKAMLEVRNIKEELSLKYLNMTPSEREKSTKESAKRFEEIMSKFRSDNSSSVAETYKHYKSG